MSKVSKVETKNGNEEYIFFCPACKCGHWFRVKGPSPCWTWNGDFDKPTIRASILVRGTVDITDDEQAAIMRGEKITPKPLVCHSFVTDGKIEYLGDCTHALAGKTVPLEDFFADDDYDEN